MPLGLGLSLALAAQAGVPYVPVSATTTNAVILSTASMSYALTSSHDIPDGDWCRVALVRCDAVLSSTAPKTIYSVGGALGTASSLNIVMNAGGAGATACFIEVQYRDAVQSTRTFRSTIPYGAEAIWKVISVQRSGGTFYIKSCDVGKTTVTQDASSGVSPHVGITASGTPTLCLPSGGTTTSRNWVGGVKFFGAGSFALTDQEIIDLANGTDPLTLSGRTWAILNKFDANATSWTDASGNGNTATRVGSGASTGTGAGPTFGPLTTVNDYADYKRIQRPLAPATTKDIAITGTWNGPASIMQARAVRRYLGTNATVWTDITGGAVGGNFAGTLPLIEDASLQYIEVRPKDYPQCVSRTYNRLGVGPVVLLAGQSHALRRQTMNSGQPSSDERAGLYDLENSPTGWKQPNGTGLRTFLNALVTHHDRPIGLIMAAKGGTGMVKDEGQGRWGDASGVLRTRLHDAMPEWGSDYEAVIWEDGTSDARQNASYAERIPAQQEITAWFRSETGRTSGQLPIVITGMARNENDIPNYDTKWQAVKQAVYDWGSEAGVFYAGSPIDQAVPFDSGIHSDTPSYLRRSRMDLQTYLFAIGAQANSAAGPRITGATRSGANVDLTIVHNGGTTLELPAGGNATGFRCSLTSNFASLLTISSTSIVDGTTFRLTLSADPGAPVYVDFGYGQAPTRTNMPQDDRTIQTDTNGALLDPTLTQIVTPS